MHEHGHDHEHEHHHDHAPGAASMEELVAMLRYMVGHNAAHIRELAELAGQLAEGILPGAGKKRTDPADPQKQLLKWEREYRVRQKW